jgi:flagellar biosynthetic protein FliR
VLGLSFAGSVAANAMSLSQIAGPGALPEATPALASVLTLAAITLALALGLHVYLVGALADSYRILPAGTLPSGAGIAAWVIAQARIVFEMGVTFAAPFLLTAVAYNVALGALNRAMPQLMVVLVGAPAITGASLILLFLCAPLIAERWSMLALETLSRPFGAMP